MRLKRFAATIGVAALLGGAVTVAVAVPASAQQPTTAVSTATLGGGLKVDASATSPRCETITTAPISTNLDPQGWNLTHDSKYVDGGIQLTSTGGASGHGGVIDKAVNMPLSQAVGLARDLTIESGSGSSFAIDFQIGTDADGIDVNYEPLYSDLLWTDTQGILPRNNPTAGNNNGQGGPYSGDFSQLESDPTVTHLWVGIWNTDEVAVLHSITYGCTTYGFGYIAPPTNTTCETIATGPVGTNLDANGWSDVDTRSAGHAAYVDGGLHIYTDDSSNNAKVAWARQANIPLSEVGQLAVDYSSTLGVPPGVTLNVTFASGLTGQLIYESVYGQDLWLNYGDGVVAPVNGGGNGSSQHGTIDQWLSVYPKAVVTSFGFGLGSGVHGNGVLHSITVGCTEYAFAYAVPAAVVTPATPTAVAATPVMALANTGSDVATGLLGGIVVLLTGVGLALFVGIRRRLVRSAK